MKTLASVLLFIATLCATAFGQSHIPTLQSNNNWLGANNFVLGNLTLGNTTHPCPQGAGYFMTGYNADLSPICQSVSASAGVSTFNTRTGAIVVQGDGSTAFVTESPTNTFTVSAPGAGVITLNGANGAITLANGTNINIVQGPTGTFTLNCSGCTGGGGSGVVGSATVARAFTIYAATGTTVNPHPSLYSIDSTMSLSAINSLISALNCGACDGSFNTVLIPDGVPYKAWTNYTQGFPSANPGTGMVDFRTGTHQQQMTLYGVVPDAVQVQFTTNSTTTLVAPSYQPFICPSSYPCTSGGDVGKTVSIGAVIGAYYGGTQYRYIDTIASIQSTTSATMTHAAPFTISGQTGWKGTDNASAFSNAMVGLATINVIGILPAGNMLTTQPIDWNLSQQVLGLSPMASIVVGTPGQDIWQQPAGDGGGDAGVGLEWGSMGMWIDNSISASSFPYTQQVNGTTTVVQPFYRPTHVGQSDSNNPKAPAFCASCDNNYVANITQGSGVICIPNGLGRLPAVGDEIVFPLTPTVLQSSVISTAGSCSTGFTPLTISPAVTNTTGYTLSQAPFYASKVSTGIQNLAVAISAGAVSYPKTITFSNPTTPAPGFEANMAQHGRLKIGNEEYDYMGCSFVSPYTCVLRAGPSTTAGWAIGTPVVPMNPCYAKHETPYPVTPTINTNDSTPSGAVFFPGLCVGNAAISQPDLDGLADTGGSFFEANLHDVAINALNSNDSRDSAAWYMAGNRAPYASSFYKFRIAGTTFGVAQGPASVNEWNIASVGPTGDGNNFTDWSVRSAYIASFIGVQNTSINRWDAYSTEQSPFDGTAVGATASLYLGYTLAETSGATVQSTAYDVVQNWNAEPENGSHIELPVYLEDDCSLCVFWGNTFEGAGAYIGSNNNTIDGGQLSGSPGQPVIFFGSNNTIRDTVDTATGKISNTWGIGSVLCWGPNNVASIPSAYGSGSTIAACPSTHEATGGYDGGSFRDGLFSTPYVSEKEGYFSPNEFGPDIGVDANPFQIPYTVDVTAPYSGAWVGCNIGPSAGCAPSHIGGFFGYYYVGQDQRVRDLPYVNVTMVKTTNNQTFNYQIVVLDPGGTNDTCPGNATLINVTVPITGGVWTPIVNSLNFTGHSGCILQFVFQNSTSADVMQVAYEQFQPYPGWVLGPVATFSVGTSCPVNGVLLGTDTNNQYWCSGGTVAKTPLVSLAITVLCHGTYNFPLSQSISPGSAYVSPTQTCSGLAAGSGGDLVPADFTGSPLSWTGFAASTSGGLFVVKYPVTNGVGFALVNNTGSTIITNATTPISINYWGEGLR